MTYSVARQDGADLVISHFGHSEVEDFLTEGLGFRPRPVFANQSSLIGLCMANCWSASISWFSRCQDFVV